MSYTVASLGRAQYGGDMHSPQIAPAGIVTNINESAKQAMTWQDRPATPPEQRKYRMLNVHEPGKRAVHYGLADDPVPPGPYGITSRPDESVAATLKGAFPTTEMGRWQLEQAEGVYASTTREPLGHGYERGAQIPGGLGTDRPFGVLIDAKGKDKARQALHIIFPTEQPPQYDEEGSQTHDLYLRSHGAFLPGEQRRRGYNWEQTQVDPVMHRFGAVDKDNYRDGVRKALQPGLDPAQQQAAAIESKIHADWKLSNTDQLGTVRKLGTGDRQLPTDHTFGMPSLKNGVRGPTVGELLHAPVEHMEPDADLGKSLREGWRNIAPEERVFGVPSILTDVPMPTKRSVNSTANYGNEPDAFQLLRPPRSVERGIHEEHYMKLRSKQEAAEILKEADINVAEEEFEELFRMASDADGVQGYCCLDTLFRARQHMLARAC